MGQDSRGYALSISEHLFRLTTESVRLHSNETRRFQTLAKLVNARANNRSKMDAHDPATMRDHLVTIPTKGNIRINLSLTRSSADSLREAKQRLSKELGSNLTFGDTLSILLFDYVVEQKATNVLQKLRLSSAHNDEDQADVSGRTGGNVLPFR